MDIDNEKMIAAVQKIQAIYDKTHKLYSNRQFLNRAWKDIGQELNVDGNVAKERWTSLRDYFQRQHRTMTTFKSGSSSTPSKKKKWPLYDSISFLVPYVSDMSASTNLSNKNDMEVVDIETSSQCSTEVPAIYSPTSEEETNTASTPLTKMGSYREPISKRYPSNRAGRKRSAQPDNNIDVEILNALRKIPTTSVPPQEEDADLCFFKSMLPQIKTLGAFQKMELQAEMHSVLFKHMKMARSRCNTTDAPTGKTQAHYSTAKEQETQVQDH